MSSNSFVGEKESTRFEFKRLGYSLILEISADGLLCDCIYEPSENGNPLTSEELSGYLAQSKVREGISAEAVNELLEAAGTRVALSGHPLAHGIPMAPGEDGKIELVVDNSLESEESGDEKYSSVDFRLVQEFRNVIPGQLVAVVHPPGGGIPGKTVGGLVIPAVPGVPLDLKLGLNTRLGEDGVSIFAEAEGRVYCNAPEISVEDVYVVKGDVNFKIGNIIYNGFVDVSGDVLDGFSVKATKGIKVGGNIGACEIESDGNVSFCGMNGQGKGIVRSGGNVVAKFINEANIEAVGDLYAESEVRNCYIRTLGTIRVDKGPLAGGEFVALAGLEASTVGSVTSLRTSVIVGVHYRDQEELNRLFNEMKGLLSAFSANKAMADPKQFAKERAAIAARLEEVRSRKHEHCNAKVNVKKMLYEGVCITLGAPSQEIKEARKGPVSIIENTIDGGFRYLSMTDISVNASDIERVFVQQGEILLRNNRNVA